MKAAYRLRYLLLATRDSSRIKSSRAFKLVLATTALGTFDGLQAKYMNIGNIGEDEAIAYQVMFMLAALVVSYSCLYQAGWSPQRNLTNLLMTIPIATLADNISIDVQALRPYLLVIPQDGYLWRIDVFGHTFLSPVAYWVNAQALAPGVINGYVAAMGIFTAYLSLQYIWVKSQIDSRLPEWNFDTVLHRWKN
ncbi:MAG: hypothetical protein JRN52_15200 [Nitrososphaerota archaeon]|nr:hypothetical protein [Nitrososphaerota archaeon]